MEGKLIKELYGKVHQINQKFFDEEYIKSMNFNKIAFNVIKEPFTRFVLSTIYFQLMIDVIINIKETPKIYDKYTKKEKKKLKYVLVKLYEIVENINQIIKNIEKISDIIKTF